MVSTTRRRRSTATTETEATITIATSLAEEWQLIGNVLAEDFILDFINRNGPKVVKTLRERGSRAGRDFFSRVQGIEAVALEDRTKRPTRSPAMSPTSSPVGPPTSAPSAMPTYLPSGAFYTFFRETDGVASRVIDEVTYPPTDSPTTVEFRLAQEAARAAAAAAANTTMLDDGAEGPNIGALFSCGI